MLPNNSGILNWHFSIRFQTIFLKKMQEKLENKESKNKKKMKKDKKK